jgi:hypothetical protein
MAACKAGSWLAASDLAWPHFVSYALHSMAGHLVKEQGRKFKNIWFVFRCLLRSPKPAPV